MYFGALRLFVWHEMAAVLNLLYMSINYWFHVVLLSYAILLTLFVGRQNGIKWH